MTSHWPLHALSLHTPDLVLRPVTEADLPGLAAQLSDDLEMDPAATRYEGLSDAGNRAVALHQGYWRSLGSWRPASWALPFAIWHGDEVVGSQTLEGENFVRLRTVDSASWLAPASRGRGWGRQARAAVLALAFGPLEATAAITSAWHDNAASLGVSRSLGYQSNGVSTHWRGDHADEMVHLRLTRERWLASPWAERVEVQGFAPCRPLFGL